MPVLPGIPQVSQWGLGANARRADCGIAVVAMILEWYLRRGALTVDQLAFETPLAVSDSGLWPGHLVALLRKHGVASHGQTGITLDIIRQQIDAGQPVIALIAYRYIAARLDQADNQPGSDGHFILLVGYDDSHFVANDPDYWTPYVERGHDTLIPLDQLQQALYANSYGGQVILLEEPLDIPAQIAALARQIEDLAAQAAAQATTPPPVQIIQPPLEGTPETKTILAGVNIRTDTIVDPANKVGGLSAGDKVIVQGSVTRNGHTWCSLLAMNGVDRTYKVGNVLQYGVIAADVAFTAPKA